MTTTGNSTLETLTLQNEQLHDYQADVEKIISRPLTAENIDSFADRALTDLIDVIQEAETSYSNSPTITLVTPKATEEASFSYYGIHDIESVLDHVADKANEIHSIDVLIQQAEKINAVIVPPDEVERKIEPGNGGGVEPKALIPRLKTTLFILSSEYNVNLTDPNEIKVTAGITANNMVRQTSYNSVEVPILGRSLLICDEEGNASYIFNTHVLSDLKLTHKTLLELSKSGLNDLLANNPSLGQRLV